MDVLIIEPLEAEVTEWLAARHSVRYASELARDPREFRQALYNVRALVLPSWLALDAKTLHYAPLLRAVGRVTGGAENIDLDACSRAGIEVVRSLTATAQAEAEFMIGAMLSLLRRVPVEGADGMLVGRELGACTVGLVGMPPAAKAMSQMISSFGSRMVGYDPSLHASDSVWERWRIAPLGLRELLVIADNSPMRFGIALGSFRDQELARNHLAGLEKRGVKGARVADRPSTLPALRFRMQPVDAALGQQLAELQKEFPQARITPCTP